MWIRLRLDIEWADLGHALLNAVVPRKHRTLVRRAESAWGGLRSPVVCLSVRSAFDLMLRCVKLPPGSEVLFSGLNVPDMPEIARHHGLVPVGVDFEPGRTSISVDSLERAVTSRTGVLVVAHLFGAHQPIDEVVAFARRHGLLLVEDCAQAFAGPGFQGHPQADVSLFSFGPIKTATALGGGVATVRSGRLARQMRQLQAGDPCQTRREYLKRVVKYMAFKFLSGPRMLGLVLWSCRLWGKTADDVIQSAARNFPGRDLLAQLRRRPSAPLLLMMIRRWQHFSHRRLNRRIRLARMLDGQLFGGEEGSRARESVEEHPDHVFWLFPVLCSHPHDLIHDLSRIGVDATHQTRLAMIAPPDTERGQELHRVVDSLLLLPIYPELPDDVVRRMGTLLRGRVIPLDAGLRHHRVGDSRVADVNADRMAGGVESVDCPASSVVG